MKSKEENVEELLNQIIEISKAKDRLDKLDFPELIGESAVTFHLKILRDLIKSKEV